LLLATTALTIGCAASIPERKVDSTYTPYGVTWNEGGGIYVSTKTFEDQGKVGLCGVYAAHAPSDPQDRFTQLALAAMNIKLDGKVISYDASFFNRVPFYEDTAPAGTASCKRTGTDWKPEYGRLKPDAVFEKSRFRIVD
jgi:hypothetical protein